MEETAICFASEPWQELPRPTSPEEISAHFGNRRSGTRLAFNRLMAWEKRFVYVLKNTNEPLHVYVGLTSHVQARVRAHNAGHCPHTASRRPWQLHVVIEFPDQRRALRFERYLKSGSGRAFAKRHFEQ